MTAPRILAATLTALAALATTAQAQIYPTKPVTVLTSIGAGSATDLECRAVAKYLEAALKQPFVVEPRPGAGGSLAAGAVARAAPDGYTLFCSGPGVTTFKLLIKDLSFDPLKDLAPVSQFSDFVGLYLTSGKAEFKTMDEFIAYAKANPGKLNYASAGRNSIVLAIEALKRELGINLVEVPYPGTPQFTQAAIANEVHLIQAPITFAKGQIDAGGLRPLMINGTAKSVLYPNLPTLADKGLNIPTGTWTGLFAPGGTPKPIVDRIATEVANYAKSPEAKKREAEGQITFVGSTPEQFRQKVENDAKRYGEIANALGWKPE